MLSRPSELVAAGVVAMVVDERSREMLEPSNMKTSVDGAMVMGGSELILLLVKIGRKIELVSMGKELGLNILIDSDSSDVGSGTRNLVVLIGVGIISVNTSPILDEKKMSTTGVEVTEKGNKMSEVARENMKVSLGLNTSKDETADIDGESTSIVEAMLKDSLDVVAEGVMTIITAVVSLGGCSVSMTLPLTLRNGTLV